MPWAAPSAAHLPGMDDAILPRKHSAADRIRVTRRVGSLSLALWHDGTVPDELGGYRHRYGYRIADMTNPQAPPHIERDLYSGVGAHVDTTTMMGTLVTLLSAAAEAYWYEMDHPGSKPENLRLFPDWVTEASDQWSDELSMLALDIEQPVREPEHADHEGPRTAAGATRAQEPGPPEQPASVVAGPVWPPGRYYTVTTRQDAAGRAMLDLVDRHGCTAAIRHLAQSDRGAVTLEAALFNQEVYHQVPSDPGTLVAGHGPYVLAYHPGTGHVRLLRELPADLPRPTAWPTRYTGVPAAAPAHEPVAPGRRLRSPAPPWHPPSPGHREPPRPSAEDGPSL
ncbi:hypothetical protein ACFT2C_04690 [Promicromonospora sp. NPDC057138]|uniref:hypothetical protein n=1 Tax=Promicromonospora sp. NPDC057138 TaxID=3346031 RepID=UPI003638E422